MIFGGSLYRYSPRYLNAIHALVLAPCLTLTASRGPDGAIVAVDIAGVAEFLRAKNGSEKCGHPEKSGFDQWPMAMSGSKKRSVIW